jgi:hypothetical protein
VRTAAKWTKEEIVSFLGGSDKAAYRRACRDNHPDFGGSHDKMAQITAMWDNLQKGHFRIIHTNQDNETRTNRTYQDTSSDWTTYWDNQAREARIRREQAEADRAARTRQAAQERAERARQTKAATDARRAKAREEAEKRTSRVKAAEAENARYREEVAEIGRKYRQSLIEAQMRHEATIGTIHTS